MSVRVNRKRLCKFNALIEFGRLRGVGETGQGKFVQHDLHVICVIIIAAVTSLFDLPVESSFDLAELVAQLWNPKGPCRYMVYT